MRRMIWKIGRRRSIFAAAKRESSDAESEAKVL